MALPLCTAFCHAQRHGDPAEASPFQSMATTAEHESTFLGLFGKATTTIQLLLADNFFRRIFLLYALRYFHKLHAA
jgi:hypothetical protein